MSLTSPVLPWKARISLSLLAAVTDFSRRRNGTVNRWFMNLFDVKASPNRNPRNGVKTIDITVDSSQNLWFRLFIPTENAVDSTLPVVVYFHGGGFTFLSPDSWLFDGVCRRIAREALAVVVSVNYRLAPESRCPAPYDDGCKVLKFLDDRNFEDFPANADLSRCFIVGDSAGGNLAHHVALRAGEYEFREVKVIGLIAIQPFFGGKERTESEIRLARDVLISMDRTDWVWRAFLPEGSDRDHEAVNVFGPNSVDISGMKYPATVVVVGGFDPLQDWQRRFYEGLRRSGKEVYLLEYPNAIHPFYCFPELPESSLLFTYMRNFIEEQSNRAFGNNLRSERRDTKNRGRVGNVCFSKQSKDEATRSEAVGMEFPLGEEPEVEGGGQLPSSIGPSPVLAESPAEAASADPASGGSLEIGSNGGFGIVDQSFGFEPIGGGDSADTMLDGEILAAKTH
ncbi:hypothetical protein HHK36_008908 [Tetracentron sinense]|uniref:Alpha/beta hydrolase fold-3 domain-containing protein n=1 Tax=Tetracentron sinense TaxID=13715 RepID=A0A834ZJW8_TETSI|nr:hypothetical protein HHK36_008908 [Tetracentron sinense]